MTSLDLTALADDVRRDVPSLDAMLPGDHASDRELLALSAAYVDRASRIAWGVALFMPIAITLVMLGVQAMTLWVPNEDWAHGYVEWGVHPAEWLVELDTPGHALVAICIAAIVAAFVRRHAAAKFARVVDGPDAVGVGRAMLARIQPWFVACWTAGVVVFCGFFATVLAFHVGQLVFDVSRSQFATFRTGWIPIDHYDAVSRIRDLWVLLPGAVIGAIWIARRSPSWLRSHYVAWGGMGVAWLALASSFSMSFLIGALDHNAVRTVIIVGGIAGLFAAVSSFAMRRGVAK
ncbi:MAG TPA: hypothetical protein VGG28_10955 [Kofleriaceae bacterium]